MDVRTGRFAGNAPHSVVVLVRSAPSHIPISNPTPQNTLVPRLHMTFPAGRGACACGALS
eukprot:scaffold16981_cov122-Isochrysis_galbana.AAC.2